MLCMAHTISLTPKSAIFLGSIWWNERITAQDFSWVCFWLRSMSCWWPWTTKNDINEKRSRFESSSLRSHMFQCIASTRIFFKIIFKRKNDESSWEFNGFWNDVEFYLKWKISDFLWFSSLPISPLLNIQKYKLSNENAAFLKLKFIWKTYFRHIGLAEKNFR